MRGNSIHDDFSSLLTMRRGAQFLGSSEKQWEAKLPTCSLIINENSQKCAEQKKCAVIGKIGNKPPSVHLQGLNQMTQQRRCNMFIFVAYFLLVMRFILLSIISAIVLSSCGGENHKWEPLVSKEGNFTVTMPTPVEKAEKTELTTFGKQPRYFVRWKPSSFAIDKFKLFEVSYTNCPASATTDSARLNATLDSAVELRKKDFSEIEVLSSQNIELNGYPGRAFFYDDNKGNTMVTVKMCIAKGKLYDLVVIAKKNYATTNESGTFFDSFKLLYE